MFQLVILAKHGFQIEETAQVFVNIPELLGGLKEDTVHCEHMLKGQELMATQLWWLRRQAVLTDSIAVLSTGGWQTRMETLMCG